jgi:hypothetical protein
VTSTLPAACLAGALAAVLGLGGCSSVTPDAVPGATPADAPVSAGGAASTPSPAPADALAAAPAPQAEPLTRAAFLRRGNAVCRAGNAALEDIGSDVAPDDEDALLAAITDEVVPNIRAQVAALRGLGSGVPGSARLTEVLDRTDAVLDAWVADPAVAFTDTRMDTINARLDDLGLTSCGG